MTTGHIPTVGCTMPHNYKTRNDGEHMYQGGEKEDFIILTTLFNHYPTDLPLILILKPKDMMRISFCSILWKWTLLTL
jgi:hypothetical protein